MVRGRRTRLVANSQLSTMETMCGLTPKRKNSRLDGRNYKICRENISLSITRMPTTTAMAQPIVAKRSARIANSIAKRNSRQAITNYFQLQTKLTTNLINNSMHLQSDGMDTTDDSDPPIPDDDDGADKLKLVCHPQKEFKNTLAEMKLSVKLGQIDESPDDNACDHFSSTFSQHCFRPNVSSRFKSTSTFEFSAGGYDSKSGVLTVRMREGNKNGTADMPTVSNQQPQQSIALGMPMKIGNGDQDDDDADDGDDSNSDSSCTNIFLQKPVLHLNIDKSPNQASSIVINKHLEISPNFASELKTVTNSKITANGHHNNRSKNTGRQAMIYRNGGLFNITKSLMKNRMINNNHKTKRRKLHLGTVGCLIDTLCSSDSNSCDSGVVADKKPESKNSMRLVKIAKPTTPHRIVCTTSHCYAQKPLNGGFSNLNFANNISTINSNTTTPKVTRNDYKLKRRFSHGHDEDTKSTPTVPLNQPNEIIISNNNQDDDYVEDNDDEDELVATRNVINIITNHKIDNSIDNIAARPLSRNSQIIDKQPKQQLTDYFPVRRSVRKTKKAVEQENLRHIERAIEWQLEDGLIVKLFKEKGRGIIAGQPFKRGEFVVEYIGDLIDQAEADRRERIYAKDAKLGCYMYYFKHKEHQWCIDATTETGKLGRLVNHSRNGNLTTKIVTYKGRPHLVLLAKEDINEGEELTYDYGDRTRESLINHPWLAL